MIGRFSNMLKKNNRGKIPKGEMIWLESSVKLPKSSSGSGSSYGHSSSHGSNHR
jgi:hypothetical protein